MKIPALFKTLHFRLSIVFMALVAAGATISVYWADSTVWGTDDPDEYDAWYEERVDAELDSLALAISAALADGEATDAIVNHYMNALSDFDFELALIDSLGRPLLMTPPNGGFVEIARVQTTVLDSMAMPDWDFGRYPDPYAAESFINRITHVDLVHAGTDTAGPPNAYLVATFKPLVLSQEIESNINRSLLLQGGALLLLTTALSGLLIMAWVSRRINTLARGVEAYREGDLHRRVPASDGDELGRLGHHFNVMATTLSENIDQLQRSEQFHRRLVANMSHDLRTPLAALRGYIETLSVDSGSGVRRGHYFDRITTNLEHIERLIQHLFQLSKLDSGEARFAMEDFSVEELATDLVRMFEGIAADREIEVKVSAENDLPLVHADAVQIGQALQNLIDNAIKFSRPGGTVRICLRRENDGVDIGVTDDGPGIATKDLEHLTERFYTADKSRTRKGESSGLGLAITEKILVRHGSRLTITSEAGRETAFRFHLPGATAEP